MSDPIVVDLRRRYGSAGVATRIAVVSKFVGDPVYRAILQSRILPDRGTVLDLGCGRGILLAAIAERRSGLKLHGIEVREGEAAIARAALGRAAVIETADLSSARLPPCDLAVILDVLHYLDPATQDDLLARTIAALRPGGVLVVREADAAAGLRFRAVIWSESIAAALRGDRGRRFYYRSARDWRLALEARGLAVELRPMGAGTPFANILVTARKAGDAAGE